MSVKTLRDGGWRTWQARPGTVGAVALWHAQQAIARPASSAWAGVPRRAKLRQLLRLRVAGGADLATPLSIRTATTLLSFYIVLTPSTHAAQTPQTSTRKSAGR